MSGFLKKLFGDSSQRELKKIEPKLKAIEALGPKYRDMDDQTLKDQTRLFKERLDKGETLDDILPDAFAAFREACLRVLGQYPFYVQLMGGIVLHQGRIAEMKTGEGKTLTATLPAYLNALSGKGVHIVTVNDYLAKYQGELMGKVYRFMGLTCGVIVHGLTPQERRAAYACDITYGTNNEIGFDYLRDNMAVYRAEQVQRGHNFAIVDEVDSIMIDEARTPLIISGQGDKSTDLYRRADDFAATLSHITVVEIDDKESQDDIEADYIVDEKRHTATITPRGVTKAEAFFKVDNLMDPENATLLHHINQAIKARGCMKRDTDYVVKDGEIIIVDEFTGRLMMGRRYSDGLHQAIEAKEKVSVLRESRTLATITFQNYFRLYHKLSGMTGTALTEEEEFRHIYSLDVIEVPTNKPMIRIDHPDQVFKTERGKYSAVIEKIKECHQKGQPVLVGTVSIEKSEHLSGLLKRQGIEHQVLNAKHHEKEAAIVAQAGRFGAVTIATNMAGRGTDIMLGGNPDFMARAVLTKEGYDEETIVEATGYNECQSQEAEEARAIYRRELEKHREECRLEGEKVKESGGLYILGTERHESRRIDNQLRGRSGRQGDPGSTAFYISMEDDVARIFGGDKMKAIAETMKFDDTQPIANAFITKQIERAQKMVENRNFSVRKQVLSYDDVMNAQREIIYKERGKVLDGLDVHDQILDMIGELAEEIIGYYADYKTDYNTWDYEAFNHALEQRMLPKGTNIMTPELCSCYDVYKLKDAVMKIALESFESKRKEAEELGVNYGDFERMVLLKTVDAKWMDHIDAMDALRRGIGLRGYGQRDPVIAYRQEGWEMFDDMVSRIHSETAALLLKAELKPRTPDNARSMPRRGAPEPPRPVVNSGTKVGRNDPCPCGSGKKYKNCCGKNA